jgi:hypothetical protein
MTILPYTITYTGSTRTLLVSASEMVFEARHNCFIDCICGLIPVLCQNYTLGR